MDAREKQIAPPTSWETFEDLCLALFKLIYESPFAQKNGRRGQPQHGVDVFGPTRGDPAAVFGVQCKGKDQLHRAKVTLGELKAELAKAEHFNPTLTHWILATTAPSDAGLQEAARELSRERAKVGLFPVTVLGWGDLQALLVQHRSALEQFYPEVAYDLPALMSELRRFSTGEPIRGLLHHLHSSDDAKLRSSGSPASSWSEVTFETGRDLGPALMGRPLGPADVAACPVLPEAQTAVAELERAFSARIEGQPGAGKSVCALQAAKTFADRGWTVFQLADPRAEQVVWPSPPAGKALYVIDDAHLMAEPVLRVIEAEAHASRMVVSTHNALAQGSGGRGAIAVDAKRAVGVIAAGLRARRAETLAVVRRADDRVGDRMLDESLDHRLDYAESHADRPWQFCFILGGGWRRAAAAADAARAAGGDVVLAAIAIRQLASRDARPSRGEFEDLLAASKISTVQGDEAVRWLVAERLVIGPNDLRTPHQRFASVVLGCILEGQDASGREVIAALINHTLADHLHPLPGLRQLLHELRFLGEYRQWTGLVDPARLGVLIDRCWGAQTPDERTFAMLIIEELSGYVPGWPRSLLDGHHETLAAWFSDPQDPTGYGIGHLTNSVRQKDEALANAMVGASDAERVAAAVSAATAKTAYNLAELMSYTGSTWPEAWKARFAGALDRKALITLGANWPKEEPVYVYSKLCQAMCWTDAELALDMVEAFVPVARRALAADPVTAFHELDDIASRTLRVLDVLGAYTGKHRPTERGRHLAKEMCAAIQPATLARQLSATNKREFQQAAMLLSFLRTAVPAKFRHTVAQIDWEQVSATIADDWAHLFHEAEVFLGVCFHQSASEAAVASLINRNADRIQILAPRLALMAPEVAYRHVERGRRIGLSNPHHVEWRSGAAVIAYFLENRPDLLEALLGPAEAEVGRALSGQHRSWFNEITLFLRLMRQAAPLSLQRMLDHLELEKAERGWADSLSAGGAPRRGVALLIESAAERHDSVGDMARRFRTRFPKRSLPAPTDLAPLC